MQGKDANCPNCGGRSFDASGGSDAYFECRVCEVPSPEYIAWYRSQWPERLEAWEANRASS